MGKVKSIIQAVENYELYVTFKVALGKLVVTVKLYIIVHYNTDVGR